MSKFIMFGKKMVNLNMVTSIEIVFNNELQQHQIEVGFAAPVIGESKAVLYASPDINKCREKMKKLYDELVIKL